jgi:hypothetical protein
MRRVAVLVFAVVLGVMSPAVADYDPLPLGTDFDYQLGGVADVPDNVGIVARDRKAQPLGDLYNICYVNGYQSQPDERGFWRKRMNLVLRRDGKPVVDEAWGEWLLDIRTDTKRRALARIVGRWTQKCADDGFDAVEYDNLDSFNRSHGLIKRRHSVAFARLLVKAAHDADLAVGQKNTVGLDGTKLGFDFAVAEECGRYRECQGYVDSFGSNVLVIEYRQRDFDWTCERFADQLPIVLRDRALSPGGEHQWC